MHSLPSTGGSGGGSAARALSNEPTADGSVGPPAAEDGSYASDFEAESPGAGPLPPARPPAAQLSSGELALLRASLLELGIGGGAAGRGAGAGAGAGPAGAEQPCSSAAGSASCGGASDEEAIPDQRVLQELSSRLGRLDSAKRRVLLAVLAKMDCGGQLETAGFAAPPGVAGAKSAGAPDAAAVAAAASQLIADSLAASGRASCASSRTDGGVPSPPALLQDAAPPPALSIRATAAVPLPAQEQQQAAPKAPPAQQSPSKHSGLMGKLAALRLGRSNSGKAGAAAAGTAAVAAAAPDSGSVPAPQQPTAKPPVHPALQRGPLPAAGGTSQLSLHQHRHSQLPSPSPRRQSHAGSVETASSASQSSPAGSDALTAFEQQLAAAAAAQDAQPPSLAASPTALVLHALQEQPDALDAAGLPAPAPAARASRSGGGFAIPRCPSGRVLELRISSTWGDPHYVGLCALELFDSRGRPLGVRCVCLTPWLPWMQAPFRPVMGEAWVDGAVACRACCSHQRAVHPRWLPQGRGAPGQRAPTLGQRPARLQRRPSHPRQAARRLVGLVGGVWALASGGWPSRLLTSLAAAARLQAWR